MENIFWYYWFLCLDALFCNDMLTCDIMSSLYLPLQWMCKYAPEPLWPLICGLEMENIFLLFDRQMCKAYLSVTSDIHSRIRFCKYYFLTYFSRLSRYVPPVVSFYYEGSGYGKAIIKSIPAVLRIKMDVFIRSENSLLFYIGEAVNNVHMATYNSSVLMNLE